jgi:dolichyl-phosphate beta-glucosyltransferase
MRSDSISTPYLSLVIPAYNEEDRIIETLISINAYLMNQPWSYEIIIVLNNCTDSTRTLVESFMNGDPSIILIDLGMIEGQGNTKGIAVTKGMLAARGSVRVFTDADLATPIGEIGKLIDRSKEGYDVVIGSRQVIGAIVDKSQVWYRVLLGRIGNFLIQTLLLPGIKDTQCGCKLFSEKAASEVFKHTNISGWGFDIETLAIARSKGYKIAEIGVHWHDVAGSKVRAGAYLSTLKELLLIFWKYKVKKIA